MNKSLAKRDNDDTQGDDRFEAVANASVDGLLVIDGDGIVQFANPSAKAMFAGQTEDIVGFHFGTPAVSEPTELQLPGDGEIRYVEMRASEFSWDGREATLASLRDITNRKEVEEEIKRFKTISDNAVYGKAIADLQGNLLYVNRFFAEMHGYEPEQLIGKHLSLFHSEEQMRTENRRIASLMREGHFAPTTVWHRHKDGTEFPMLMSGVLIKDDYGNPQCIAASAIDMTAQHQAVARLAESEKLLSRSQEIAHIGSWKLDLTTKCLTWSDEVYRIFGCEPHEFAPTYEAFLDFIHPEDRVAVDEAYSRSQREGNDSYEIEHRIVRQNSDEVRYVHERCVHERDESGAIIRSTGMVQDITERKQAENYREMGKEILQILNEPGDPQESIPLVLDALKTRTGFDAVGLRLQDGEDFPYFAQDGFPADFLETENTLVERDKDGGVCRDKDGNVCLECTCGLVLSGKTDPSNPLFTPGGSCWTNDSFPLLDLPADQDPRLHPRNNCIHQGYTSVALIPMTYSRKTCVGHDFKSMARVPIRVNDRIVGLIQLNDKRKGRFTPEMIEILESVAAHIGSMLMRSRAEEELSKSEENLRITLNSIGDGVISTDVAGRVVSMNPVAEALTGWTMDEAAGQSLDQVFQIINEQSRQTVKSPVDNVLQTGQIVGLANHTLLIAKDGRETPIADSGAPIKNAAGETSGVVLVYRDQTQERESRRALEESQQRLESMFRAAPAGIGLVRERVIMEANEHLYQMTGYGADELIGQNARMLYPSQKEYEYVGDEKYRQIDETGTGSVETVWQRKDGARINVRLSSAPLDPVDLKKGVTFTALDITERKQAEEALRKNEKKYRSLVEGLNDAVYRMKLPEGRYEYFSSSAEDVFGYPCEEFLNNPFFIQKIIHPDYAGYFEDKWKELLDGNVQENYEYKIIDPEGNERWIVQSNKATFDDSGRITGIEGLCRNITERKKDEKLLIESEALFRGMFKKHNAVMLLVDPNTGRIVDANQAAAQYYGYPLEDLMQTRIQQINTLSPAETDKKMGRALDGQVNIFEFQHLLANGQIRDVEVHSTSLTIQNQTLLFSIIHDISERKRSEKALRESEELLSLSQGIAHTGSWKLDLTTNRLTWSDEVYRIFGCKPQEFAPTYEAFLDFVHPDDRAAVDEAYSRSQREGNDSYEIEHRIVRRNSGEVRHVYEHCVHERDGADTIIQSTGMVQDITERKLSETYREMGREILQILNEPGDLQESIPRVLDALKTRIGADAVGLRLQGGEDFPYFAQDGFPADFLQTENTLVERDKDGGVCRDKDGKVCLECTCGLVLSGKTDPTNPLFTPGGSCWTNNSFPLLDLPADQDPRLHARNNCIHQGYASVALIPVRTKDRIVGLIQLNDKRKGRFTPETIEILEGIAAHIGSALMRKQAERELRRLSIAIEQSPETVVITDTEATIQYANPAFETTTGYTCEEAIGQNPRILKSGQQDAKFYTAMWNTLLDGRVWEGRMVNKRKDGSLYTEEASIAPVKDSNGTITNYVGVKRDITAELEREDMFQQAQKMESVGRLAGGVAHDFNNMLMGIMGYADMCRDEVGEDHPVREWIDEIKHGAERSADLTRQLLAFARKQTIAPKIVDVNDIISTMLKMTRRLIGEDIDLSWQPGANLRPVKIDPGQIDQVLANLCVNARDAIGGAGKVTIETENVEIDADYCADYVEASPGHYAMLAVSDDGCGMDKETLTQVFDPFFTTKSVGEGTGLGLATVYGIVRQNNGFVNVYSEPGKGTTFRVYLPVCAEEAAQGHKTDANTAMASFAATETILVVEDEPAIRRTLQRHLDKLGYTAISADAPDEALRLAAEQGDTIDLLITDVVMPGMSGRDLAKKLAADHPGMKILYISGYTANILAHRGVLENNVEFLSKPFGRDDLAHKVREMLD